MVFFVVNKQENNEIQFMNSIKILGVTLFFLFHVVVCSAQSEINTLADSLNTYNPILSPKEMQNDLQVFKDIREKVNSGLYIYRTKEEIDSIYNWAFEKAKEPMPVADFFKIIIQLTDFEGSLHNYTEPSSDLMNFFKRQEIFFPYHLTYIEGNMIFDGNHETIPAGSQIVSINGIKDKKLMQSFYKYFPVDGHSNSYKVSSSVEKIFKWRYFMEYGVSEKFVVRYKVPGANIIKTTTLPAVSYKQQEKNFKNRYSAPVSGLLDYKQQPAYSFQMIKPEIGLLNLRWFGFTTGKDEPEFKNYVRFIDSVFTKLDQRKTPNLIIDVRNNPGGSDPTFEQPVMYLSDHTFKENLGAHIIYDPKAIPFKKYFYGFSTKEPVDSLTLSNAMVFIDDYFEDFKKGKSLQNKEYNPVYYPKEPAYHGKVYLLINQNTASAASHFASLVKAYARDVAIVGVETVGGYYKHNGHIGLVYELPNSKVKTKFSVVYVVHDAPVKDDQPEGRGVIPDYEVWPRIDDFIEHKDTQMNFVLELIEGSD